jgi:hypothetical protein
MEFVDRVPVVGGLRDFSRKRYRAVFDKLLVFARSKSLTSWNQFTVQALLAYVTQLEGQDYAERADSFTMKRPNVRWVESSCLKREPRAVGRSASDVSFLSRTGAAVKTVSP